MTTGFIIWNLIALAVLVALYYTTKGKK